MTFHEAEKQGLRVSLLDSTYKSGLHADSTRAVFAGRQGEFVKAYKQTLQDLGAHLKANNFTWGSETRSFNRIYFNKDGAIDYFLYSFRKDEIPVEKEREFGRLLNGFVKGYKFPLTAATGFSQCSPVRYND